MDWEEFDNGLRESEDPSKDILNDALMGLDPTWWVFDDEPGMDDLMDQAGDSLQEMFRRLNNIAPFQNRDGGDRLFLARFEFPAYQGEFQHGEAVFADGEVLGFIDFLAGFPIECIELLGVVGQYSSDAAKLEVKPGEGPVPPAPDQLFEGFDGDYVLVNYMYLAAHIGKWMATTLNGEPQPENLHWWVRTNLVSMEGGTFPVPGEFVALAVRIMVGTPWGRQKSSPFLYSGNWMDTVFLTSGKIEEVIAPTDNMPYPTYKVKWRKHEVTVKPSDFAEYQVGDRVTILKDVAANKPSQLWKDKDMQDFGDNWVIAPVTFYGGI